jgi:hypothetical protein
MTNIETPPPCAELYDLQSQDVIVTTTYLWFTGDAFRQYKNKIIIMFQGEYLSDGLINDILAANQDNYFFILSGHEISDNVKKQHDHHAKFIFLKYFDAYYAQNMHYANTDFHSIVTSPKTRHFLSLNNRASWPRQSWFYFMEKYQLRDKSYTSYLADINRTSYKSLCDIDQEIGTDTWYVQNLDLAACQRALPLYTGLDDFQSNCWGAGNIKYYQDCFCSVVHETYCYEPYPFFSEKIFKPLVFFQPFLLHSNVGSLRKLQDQGFQTFSAWWDESYDELFDHRRYEAMLRVALEISDWSLEKVNDIYQDMIPVLTHNHNHFITTLPESYAEEIQEVKSHIQLQIATLNTSS